MRHVGQKIIFGHDGQIGVFQRLRQDLLLLDLPPKLLVHPAVAHYNLIYLVSAAHIDKPELEVLHLPLAYHPVINVIGAAPRYFLPDILRRGSLGHHLPILRVDPNIYIVSEIPVQVPGPVFGPELPLGALAQPVGQNAIFFQLRIEDGLVIDAQPLYYLQAPQMLLVDDGPLPVILLHQALVACFAPPLLLHPALHLLGGVSQKDIEKVPYRLSVDKVAVVLNPANRAVSAGNAVLYIVQVVLALGNLPLDTLLYLLQVVGEHQPPKGTMGHILKLIPCIALKDAQQALVGVDNALIPVGMVD